MTGIFVSYRRDDTLGVAGRLCDHLQKHFPRERIFFDLDAMQPGRDFVAQIETELSHCAVLLALIGTRWLDARDGAAQRRLDSGNDFVRLEIAAALERGIPVIPILVDGAPMPAAGDLPADLKALARRHALELRNSRFVADTDAIVHAVRQLVGRRPKAPVRVPVRALLAAAALLACLALGAGVWLYTGRSPPPAPALPAPSSAAIGQQPSKAAEASPAPPPATSPMPRSQAATRCQQDLDAALAAAPITFRPADYALNPASAPTLDNLARIAAGCDGVLIEVQSHTDRADTRDYNIPLTQRRAQAVVRYLVEAGVPAERLRPVGYADSRPLVPDGAPGSQALNRRIQFVVSDR
jgi:outer membrane protein OmpA-like peptidoglycan-associated protein